MNQFLCSQTAAGFKIFVKLCAPLKKPDMGWRRATGGVGGSRGRDKVSGWACTRCGVFAGRSDFAQQSQRLAAAQRVFRLPTRNLLNYLWQLSCNFILLPSTEPTFHRPRMLGTQRPPSAPCLLNPSPSCRESASSWLVVVVVASSYATSTSVFFVPPSFHAAAQHRMTSVPNPLCLLLHPHSSHQMPIRSPFHFTFAKCHRKAQNVCMFLPLIPGTTFC